MGGGVSLDASDGRPLNRAGNRGYRLAPARCGKAADLCVHFGIHQIPSDFSEMLLDKTNAGEGGKPAESGCFTELAGRRAGQGIQRTLSSARRTSPPREGLILTVGALIRWRI
jgi:hypothetical protein